jgi:hypothetical protein
MPMLTVTGCGAGGAGGGAGPTLLPPPPQAATTAAKTNAASSTQTPRAGASLGAAVFGNSHGPKIATKAATTVPSVSHIVSGNTPGWFRGAIAEGRELTVTVSSVVTFPLAGKVAALGLKAQEIPEGALRQAKVTSSVKPFSELRVRLNLAELPTATVATVDENDALKSTTRSSAVALRMSVPPDVVRVAVTVKV